MNISRYTLLLLSLFVLNTVAMEPIAMTTISRRATVSQAGMPKSTIFKEEAEPVVRTFKEAISKIRQIERVEATRPGIIQETGAHATWFVSSILTSMSLHELTQINPYFNLLPFAILAVGGSTSFRIMKKNELADKELEEIRATLPQLHEKFNAFPFEQKKEVLASYKEILEPELWKKVRGVLENRKKEWSLDDQAKILEALKLAHQQQQSLQNAECDELWGKEYHQVIDGKLFEEFLKRNGYGISPYGYFGPSMQLYY